MKKIIIIAFIATSFAACNESKDPSLKTENTKPETATPATGNDAALTTWLSGKMLVSTLADAKYDMWNNLKLKADGTCTDKDNAAAKWSVKDGQFIFESIVNMKMTIQKKAEDTLIFKGDVTKDQEYILKPIN
jgi:hypothetical protein